MATSRSQKRAAKAKQRKALHKQKAAPKRVAPVPLGPLPSANAPLGEATLLEVGYDANADLDASGWTQLAERERLSRVAKYHHAVLPRAQLPPSMQRHAAMHVIVETQLADGAPAEAADALARLRAEGMSRHDAIHAIGWLATEHMKRAMAKQRPVDDKVYAQDLTQLTVRNWLKMAGLLKGR